MFSYHSNLVYAFTATPILDVFDNNIFFQGDKIFNTFYYTDNKFIGLDSSIDPYNIQFV
jgi:hypothetical protein